MYVRAHVSHFDTSTENRARRCLFYATDLTVPWESQESKERMIRVAQLTQLWHNNIIGKYLFKSYRVVADNADGLYTHYKL